MPGSVVALSLKTSRFPLLELGPFLLPRAELGTKSGPRQFAHMHYRGIEYAVVEGIGHHMWRWSVFVGGAVKTGQAHHKQAAMVAAEKAIDRALAVKRVRLVPPERSD
jgi:hypothetical protein